MATRARTGFKPRAKRSAGGVSRIVRDNYGSNWWEVVKQVKERSTIYGEIICYICKKPILKGEKTETHHITSLSRGGVTSKANLDLVHSSCHDTRHPHLMKRRGGAIS